MYPVKKMLEKFRINVETICFINERAAECFVWMFNFM